MTACFDPRPEPGAACGVGAVCPDGLSCERGVCVAPLELARPEPLDELNSPGDELAATLTADGRVIVFASNRGGRFALYTAARDTAGGRFENLKPLGIDVDPDGGSFDAELSADGTELIVSSPDGLIQLSRLTVSEPWSAAEPIRDADDDSSAPTFGFGDLRLVASNDGEIDELARTTRGGEWDRVGSHDRLAGLTDPTLSSDGLDIFLCEDGDLVHAYRSLLSLFFGPARRVGFDGGLDRNRIADPELSGDGSTLVLSIQVDGNYDLYTTTR